MKLSIKYTLLCLLAVAFSCLQLHAQDPTQFNDVDIYRAMFDSADPTSQVYQPALNGKSTWEINSTMYFVFKGNDLLFGTDPASVSMAAFGEEDSEVGPNVYTVSAAKPSTGSAQANVINLFFDYIKVEDGTETGGYGLLQFTTLTQTELDNPNSLMIQSHHVQIAENTMFRVDYKNVSGTCTSVDFQFVVNW